MSKTNPDYKPRLTIDLREDQRQRLSRLIPWGMAGHVFRKAIDDVLDLVEEFGAPALTAILHDMIPDKKYLSIAKEAKRHVDSGKLEEKHTGDE